jgi:hypothetical protein
MARTTLALVLALAGCAHPMNSQAPDDSSPAGDLAAAPVEDLAAPLDFARAADAGAHDLAQATADLAQPPALACHVVINEVQTGTTRTGTEEWVELYNPCSSAIALAGWKLAYRSAGNTNGAAGSDSSSLYTWSSGSIPAGGYRVYAGGGWTGASDGALGSGLASAGGAVGLRDASGALVDSVAYGTAAGGFAESTAAPAPPTTTGGASISRLPNGADTDDNSADFHVTNTPTPGAANH